MTAPDRRLTPAARQLLQASDQERLASLSAEPFVLYGTAKLIHERMNEILLSARSHRPASMLIAGETNNGKTMIVRRFLNANQPVDEPDAEAINVPVLYMQMPPTPDPRQFYFAILDKLNVPVQRSSVMSYVQMQALRVCRLVNLKILIIDELHNIQGGRVEQQRSFLNLLRYFSNELSVHIVGCGLVTAVRALQSDDQLANRFEHWPLPKWVNDNRSKVLLNTLEMNLPLKQKSDLSSPELMGRILGLSGGTIGEIVRLLSESSRVAIKTGTECIDLELIDELQWIPPADRRKAAEAVLGYRS